MYGDTWKDLDVTNLQAFIAVAPFGDSVQVIR